MHNDDEPLHHEERDLEWPLPPVWPEDLPKVRALLTPQEYQALIERDLRQASRQAISAEGARSAVPKTP